MAVGHSCELRQGSAEDGSPEPPFGNRARFVVELDRIDVAEPAEHFEVVAGSAADLEDARMGGRHCVAADQIGEHLAARSIPPMALVELGHLTIDDALHQPNTHWRLRA